MHLEYMKQAYELALKAFNEDEIPIGAIVVYEGKVIGKGYNQRQKSHNPLDHAETIAIKEAAQFLGSWNLCGCTLYVTVEPCPMCAGALIQSQCSSVVYGASEPNSGSFGSITDLSKFEFNHKIEVIKGVMESENRMLMKEFFKKVRRNKVKVKRIDAGNFDDYLMVRKEVFVKEQNVDIEIEIDDLDVLDSDQVIHVGAFIDDEIVGTCRLIKEGKDLRIGRVAVLKNHRRSGVGRHMMLYAEKQALNNGFHNIVLGAQVTAIPFYESLGFTVVGDIYLDADIEHKDMKKKV